MTRPRRILLGIILGFVTLIAGAAGYVWWALHHVPAFYAQAVTIPAEKLQPASDALLRKTAALTSDLQKKSGAWQFLLTAEQINGWLAVDVPKNHPQAIPPAIHDPRVEIHPGGLIAAARYEGGMTDAVISLETDIFLPKDQPDAIAIRIKKLRAGALPIGLKKIVDGFTKSMVDSDWELQWRQIDGDPVAYLSPAVGQNARARQWHLDAVELRDGEIFIAGHIGAKVE
jgi:hypothetical protein